MRFQEFNLINTAPRRVAQQKMLLVPKQEHALKSKYVSEIEQLRKFNGELDKKLVGGVEVDQAVVERMEFEKRLIRAHTWMNGLRLAFK